MSLRLLFLVLVAVLFAGCDDSKNSSPVLSGPTAATFVIDDNTGGKGTTTVDVEVTLVDDGKILNSDGSVTTGDATITAKITSNPGDVVVTNIQVFTSSVTSDFNGTSVKTTKLIVTADVEAETNDGPIDLTITASDGSGDVEHVVTFTFAYLTVI